MVLCSWSFGNHELETDEEEDPPCLLGVKSLGTFYVLRFLWSVRT